MSDKFKDLRWVRVFSPIHIPKSLVEQVKDRDYSVEDFYKYHELNCLVHGKEGPTLNPFHHLYVIVDKENMVKGFFWFVIDALSKDVFINTFSMDPEYWENGKAMKLVIDYMKEILKKLKLKKVYWFTRYPKHSERHGFKISKNILMEYTEESDGKDSDGGRLEKGKHRAAQSPATATI
jgi:N-acetylglutamate synthase-like GNAT family acetyltransferase